MVDSCNACRDKNFRKSSFVKRKLSNRRQLRSKLDILKTAASLERLSPNRRNSIKAVHRLKIGTLPKRLFSNLSYLITEVNRFQCGTPAEHKTRNHYVTLYHDLFQCGIWRSFPRGIAQNALLQDCQRFREHEFFQTSALLKCAQADCSESFRKFQVFQCIAFCKGIDTNFPHLISCEKYTFQFSASIESTISHRADIRRDRHFGNRRKAKRTDADFRQAVRQLDLSHSSQPVEGVRTNRRDAFLDHDFRNAVDIALPRTIQHTICLFTGSIAVMGFRSAVHPIVR